MGTRGLLVLMTLGVLLVGCDAVDEALDAFASDEDAASETTEDGEAGDAAPSDEDDATTESASQEGSADEDEAGGSDTESDTEDDGGSDTDGEQPEASGDLAATLHAAIERVREAIDADVDPFEDERCDLVATWDETTADTSGLPSPDASKDEGHLMVMDDLEYFGCGFGERQSDGGFQQSALVVSFQDVASELPPDFEATTTPAGTTVSLGEGEINDMAPYDGPVNVAVVRADGVELHVTSPPEVSALDDLLPVVDAAIADLAAAE